MTQATADTVDRLAQWEAWLRSSTETPLDPQTPIVDAHHHLWDRAGHTYLPKQFEADASGHRLQASVYVECRSNYLETGREALKPVGETQYVAGLVAADQSATPQAAVCAGIVGFADLSLGDGVEAVLQAHEAAGQGRLKGIRYATAWDADPRIHSTYPSHAGMLREPLVQAGARCLARRGLSLDTWAYFHQLDDVVALARACPDLMVVVDHVGGPLGLGGYSDRRQEVFAQWRQTLQAFATLDNVVMKFGGLAMPLAGFSWRKHPTPPPSQALAAAWRPYFEVCLDVFGPARCMFESNFPVDRTGCTYTSLWNAFKTLAAPLSASERSALLQGTAQRVYRL
jgi:predicted TIM-barrel fold metal-dependent hydrolase